LNIQDFLKLIRARWLVIALTTAVTVAGAVAVTLLTTPLYQASTRLYVSTPSNGDAGTVYTGTLSSQKRVLSYAKLAVGQTLAQRTIDKLHLDMTAAELKERVTATAATDTVLIDVSVLDPSPVQARDIADALSDELVVMVSELETSPDGTKANTRVVVEQHATTPDHPVVPKTSTYLAIGIVLGALSGIALVTLRALLNNTVNDRQVIEEITGAGLVANIPLDKDRRKDPAISFATEHSPIAEAFCELRTNLQFLEVDDPPRVLVVTSALPSEGKSTTAINIALALAEAEHNVVLVDGDMRRPKLDEYLGLIGSVGLSTVVAGRAPLDEVLQKTRFPGLTTLTSGPVPPNPSELLGSQTAKKILSELRGSFDYVIVDSSPLLAVTDAAILAAEADGVLVIAQFAKTKREQLTRAVEKLTHVEARILGGIFTMSPTGANDYYHYRNYGEDEKSSGSRSNSGRHGHVRSPRSPHRQA
jgi:capsular exopolysaccharide synthesis family protein